MPGVSGSRAFPDLAKTWVPPQELRRLAAYRVLAAYDNNQAGQLAAAGGDESALERRELGDAANLVDTALGYLLGSEQKVAVEGAEHADEETQTPGAAEAAAVQDRLRKWADKELLTFRVQQAERAAVLLGDSVMVLACRSSGRRCGSTIRGSSSRSGAMRMKTARAACIWRGSCRRTTTQG